MAFWYLLVHLLVLDMSSVTADDCSLVRVFLFAFGLFCVYWMSGL